jgi:tetratricopeptide (TPR) repeat protein
MINQINPDNAYDWTVKAFTLIELNRNSEAVECYTKSLELDPTNANVWESKGNTLRDLKRNDEAVACYDKSLELDPNRIPVLRSKLGILYDVRDRLCEIWVGEGAALRELGRYEDAVVCCNKALEINPNHVDAWECKGFALSSLHRNKEALVCYKHCWNHEQECIYPDEFPDSDDNPTFESLLTENNDDLVQSLKNDIEKVCSTIVYANLKLEFKQIVENDTNNIPIRGTDAGTCPICGSILVWRRATKTDELYRGCTNFDGGCRYQERSY